MYYNNRKSIVFYLILINVVCYAIQLLPGVGSIFTSIFEYSPTLFLHGQIWRGITYGFLHDPNSIFHILFNMFGLWMFGSTVEDRLGPKKFLIFYLSAVLFSALFSILYLIFGANPTVIGASGGVIAVVTLFSIYYPNTELLIWGIVPIKAWVSTLLFILISISGTVSGAGNTAHLTHLGGVLFAFIYYFWDKKGFSLSHTLKVKKEGPIIHYFEPRKSRQEIKSEKEEVDRVLKKISSEGMQSLTEDEYRILEKASGGSVKRR